MQRAAIDRLPGSFEIDDDRGGSVRNVVASVCDTVGSSISRCQGWSRRAYVSSFASEDLERCELEVVDAVTSASSTGGTRRRIRSP